ncbi:MAG: hypothetical protein HYY52_02540 [Candidatus Melainabacteria bacterium]|nr:hypothetical protein [Candidatus Melainabacteria bacterium]
MVGSIQRASSVKGNPKVRWVGDNLEELELTSPQTLKKIFKPSSTGEKPTKICFEYNLNAPKGTPLYIGEVAGYRDTDLGDNDVATFIVVTRYPQNLSKGKVENQYLVYVVEDKGGPKEKFNPMVGLVEHRVGKYKSYILDFGDDGYIRTPLYLNI